MFILLSKRLNNSRGLWFPVSKGSYKILISSNGATRRRNKNKKIMSSKGENYQVHNITTFPYRCPTWKWTSKLFKMILKNAYLRYPIKTQTYLLVKCKPRLWIVKLYTLSHTQVHILSVKYNIKWAIVTFAYGIKDLYGVKNRKKLLIYDLGVLSKQIYYYGHGFGAHFPLC